MSTLPPPFPAGLRRPRQTRTRAWLRWLPLALIALLPVSLLWRVQAVDVQACPGVPASACSSLEQLVGTPVVLLDLARLRDDLRAWPGVATVEVRLEVPGTVHVVAHPAEVAGSVQVGRGWRAVCEDGRVGAALAGPRPPVLAGFDFDRGQLGSALGVGHRLASETGLVVQRLRRILPGDFEAVLTAADGSDYQVHVAPGGSGAERAWTQMVRAGGASSWADLRGELRMVVGGAR